MAELFFDDYKSDKYNWITLASAEYYPDYVPLAMNYYGPVLARFHDLLTTSPSSPYLFRSIMATRSMWMRIQLCRVFRKYISPSTPVELLKVVKYAEANIDGFKHQFRNIAAAQAAFTSRPMPDEALCTLMWEYKDRGRVGYDLTEELFKILRDGLVNMVIEGPERAGPDIQLKEVWSDYPRESRPVDFIIKVID